MIQKFLSLYLLPLVVQVVAQQLLKQDEKVLEKEKLNLIEQYPDYADVYLNKDKGILNPDAFKTLAQLASQNGFQSQQFFVSTSDGYIICLWRIPGKVNETIHEGIKPPVMLVHGLESDMMQWAWHLPSLSPAFILANSGYDVWLVNNRGTRYSLYHDHLETTSKEYWNFDWEDMGTKDIPACIEFILTKTGFYKISYIGHSEGTTQLMAGAALLPEYYNSKIEIAFLLAPAASLQKNKIELFSLLSEPLTVKIALGLIDTIHQWNLLPYNFLLTDIGVGACHLFKGRLCTLILEFFADSDPNADYHERYDVYMSNLPAGSSAYNLIHYGQLTHLKEQGFKRYDYYSKEKNQKAYGQDTPPDYNLSLLNFPIALLYGSDDLLVQVEDAKWTQKQLGKNVMYVHEYVYYGHMSFAIAKYMEYFGDVMQVLNQAHNRTYVETLRVKEYQEKHPEHKILF